MRGGKGKLKKNKRNGPVGVNKRRKGRMLKKTGNRRTRKTREEKVKEG